MRQKTDTDDTSLVSHIAESIKPQVMEEVVPVIIKTFEPKIADLVSQATLSLQEHMITEIDSRVAQISHAFDDEMSKKIRTDVLRSLGQALTQQSEQ